MRTWRDPAPKQEETRQRFETANDRFQRHYLALTAIGLLAATGAHIGLFALNPRMLVQAMELPGEGIVNVTLPPEVRIPPPPRSIVRPATPHVAERPVAEELTIGPTTFAANPAENLPPPPARMEPREKEGPFYVPHDLAPRILNGPEVATLLTKNYPRTLREAGIEGKVVLWIYVTTDGRPGECRLHSSSGYSMLDEAARKVAEHMRFEPAQLRDKPVAVWIAQPFEFSLA
jgi:protein TonB